MVRDTALLDAIVDLDMLLLKEHTEAAGDRFERESHRQALAQRFDCAEIIDIWRDDELIAYSYIWPKDDRWFVGGFAIRPDHRNAAIMSELLMQLLERTNASPQVHVESHVYKANRLSMDFHQKLGFEIIRENEKGVAFVHRLDVLRQHPIVQRAAKRADRGEKYGS
ncbi:GNAT family N-acetyltransferase [Maritalea sp. S77]|uniref:GNAT family N-acetyltransferase n=1 Tax=Maritalea sp. S77 TaxID=3415125 RepID=UPI003C7D7094